MNKRLGKQTIKFNTPVVISETGTTVGKKEGEGPLAGYFDEILTDDRWDCDSWEQAESKMQHNTAMLTLRKANLRTSDINYILGGDLINQCTSTHYGIRELNIPFFGLYGACSTMIESVSLGSMIINGGFAEKVLCLTSSHFCSAERQFRNPLEYGSQRAPSSQWTVTGCGTALLTNKGTGPKITHVTTGKIVDFGITDLNNMGAAMAPAAVDTLTAHFNDTGFRPEEYDMIVTGDLGVVGSDILTELMLDEGYDISELHHDCGKMIFNIEEQDVHAGGSGCGCCASVFCGYLYKEMTEKKLKKIFVMATGALMSPTLIQQGESIPGIAHGVTIEME